MELPENVRLSEDTAYVQKLREVMAKNGGYCPCRIQRTPENICICAEFRAQIADPDFTGFCHCKYYFKEKAE
jgi:ferredoxin-thioredoxin reductase catalytic subunit